MRTQIIAVVPVTTAGACYKRESEGYRSRNDKERVLHVLIVPRANHTRGHCGLRYTPVGNRCMTVRADGQVRNFTPRD